MGIHLDDRLHSDDGRIGKCAGIRKHGMTHDFILKIGIGYALEEGSKVAAFAKWLQCRAQ
jgi:hypothetical protein